MTVADLIEVLQQCPNPNAPVMVRASGGVYGEDARSRLEVEEVREDRGIVVIETE